MGRRVVSFAIAGNGSSIPGRLAVNSIFLRQGYRRLLPEVPSRLWFANQCQRSAVGRKVISSKEGVRARRRLSGGVSGWPGERRKGSGYW